MNIFYLKKSGLVQRGKLQAGETLLVTGAAGGMGIAAIQLGKVRNLLLLVLLLISSSLKIISYLVQE